MATNAICLSVDGERLAHALREAREKLDSAQGEVVLDFSSVQRIDPGAIRAMEHLADAADGNGTKLFLSNVSVDIYKVLKLMKLSPRFSFRS
jgi:anti-anti-sigma regulatory factor